MKTKIQTIDITALEWFDKINGNSYFAGTVTINYGLPDSRSFNMPFQYGYGDHYKDIAAKVLEQDNQLPGYVHNKNGSTERLWNYCDRNKIILRATKHENCKKRELKEIQ